MYPRLTINLKKLKQNLDAVAKITTQQGDCSLMIVTKGMCADEKVVTLVLDDERVGYLADSRIENIKTFAEKAASKGKETVLLRLPMHCEIEDVIRYVDLSFNSEISTIRLLSEEAVRQEKTHKILLMIDLGDLREGIYCEDELAIFEIVAEIFKLENIDLIGVGVNLTCYGAIVPKNNNLSLLVDIAEKLEKKFGVKLKMRSGGNSSSIYLIWGSQLPSGINNLRLGEGFMLGNETAFGEDIPNTVRDALILEAQIIELQEKPSLPIGEASVDAFGQKPCHEDKGIMKRAILAIGKQDTDDGSMTPQDKDVDILGCSSDHFILDVSKSSMDYKVGDIISFEIGYGSLLRASTSKYVHKHYIV